MQVEDFWQHWAIEENPFRAEEARNDPVYTRLLRSASAHPEFEKIYGEPDNPTSAVVFGEKGSGKTAIRLLIERLIGEHNSQYPDRMAWVVAYHDLNPVLDRLKHAEQVKDPRKLLSRIRVEDHLDAIISQATTRLVDAIVAKGEIPHCKDPATIIRRLPRQQRLDLAELAILYDQPRSGSMSGRWARLKKHLKFGRMPWLRLTKWLGVTLLIGGVGLMLYKVFAEVEEMMLTLSIGLVLAASLLMLGIWAWRHIQLWLLSRQILADVKTVERRRSDLHLALADLPYREMRSQPIPEPGDQDSRYQLIGRMLDLLENFGYCCMIVLVDRVDEPAMINGDAEKMRDLVWPMLNNKFLQQDRVGIKMLLPVELRHLLKREDAAFFQQARLDKQHMIDRLVWSGTMLYDLANRRLNACRASTDERISVLDLFEEDVQARDLIDALDQMHQPRDAFKFLYQVILEHCSNVPADQAIYRIPRLRLETVRKQQSQRVQELYRGLTPA